MIFLDCCSLASVAQSTEKQEFCDDPWQYLIDTIAAIWTAFLSWITCCEPPLGEEIILPTMMTPFDQNAMVAIETLHHQYVSAPENMDGVDVAERTEDIFQELSWYREQLDQHHFDDVPIGFCMAAYGGEVAFYLVAPKVEDITEVLEAAHQSRPSKDKFQYRNKSEGWALCSDANGATFYASRFSTFKAKDVPLPRALEPIELLFASPPNQHRLPSGAILFQDTVQVWQEMGDLLVRNTYVNPYDERIKNFIAKFKYVRQTLDANHLTDVPVGYLIGNYGNLAYLFVIVPEVAGVLDLLKIDNPEHWKVFSTGERFIATNLERFVITQVNAALPTLQMVQPL